MKRSDIFPSQWLTAADIPEEGMVVTIDHVETAKMRDGKEKPIVYFVEVEKGMVCNVTNWNQIEKLYGEESDDWADERITLYAGETTFDGDVVACIRVKNKKPKAAVKEAPKDNGKGKKPAEPVTQEEIDAETDFETGMPLDKSSVKAKGY